MEAQLTVEEGPTGRTQASLPPGRPFGLGRGPGANLTLRDERVGPVHASLKLEDGVLQVVDHGFPGGTLLNGEPLPPHTPVEAFGGDALRLGSHVVRITLLGRRGKTRRRTTRHLIDPILPTDEFELVKVLGSGAHGKVYAARWRARDDDPLALKVLHPSVKPGSPHYERFVRECSTVARLNSPFVVAVYDLRQVDDRAYALLELVEGPSVRDALRDGPLPVHHALRVGEDVARALEAAAEEGIVHRDVKPANVLLSPQGRAKLCDFGIAKDLESTLHTLTASGIGMGTLAYLPPEQVNRAKHVEPSADVYSLGATLYHMLAGRPPFSPSSAAALAQILHEEPTPLAQLRPDAPLPVVQAVHALLDKDPDARPPLWKLAGALKGLREQHYPGLPTEDLFAPRA